MKTILAIKGHVTRYKEVIEILEMLGGKNEQGHNGHNPKVAYYICDDNIIRCDCVPNIYPNIYKCVDYTLEEFLEKYPYKVGDKVIVKGLSEYPKSINFMKWFDGDIHYSFDNETWFLPSALNPYKEETMEVKRMAFAITGHKTRGEEVIKILEMLGGENNEGLWGDNPNVAYYISYDNTIVCTWGCNSYTLEEFLAKFPYKIGDKVQHKGSTSCDSVYEVEKMQWANNHVEYTVKNIWYNNCYYVVTAEDLQPYKEEVMGTITIDDFKANTKEWLIDQLHGMVISKAIKTIGDIHEELHKPQYPKTYVECARLLNCFGAAYIDGYKGELLDRFQELIICRDAYWKIAGEQMGLGKPWKPDWLDTNTQKYCIYYVGDEIKKQPMLEVHHFLAFPTKEMSDMFFENFKELIESCKDFL